MSISFGTQPVTPKIHHLMDSSKDRADICIHFTHDYPDPHIYTYMSAPAQTDIHTPPTHKRERTHANSGVSARARTHTHTHTQTHTSVHAQ
jgi:hypothetical protein